MITKYFYKLINLKKAKQFYFLVILAVTFILTSFLTSAPALAMGNMSGMGSSTQAVDTTHMSPLMQLIEVDNPLYAPIDVTLDVIGVILMLIAAFVIIKSISEYGKSTIGIALLYLFNATLVLGAIRVIFILDDDSIVPYTNVKDITEMTAWHTLFYYGIILFFLAGRTLTGLVSSNKGKSSYTNAMVLLFFTILLAVSIIVSMPFSPVQNFLESNLQNTWFNTFGWFHIIALLMAGGIAMYLARVKNKFKGYTGVIGDISIAIALLACIHLWELLNESWHVIIVSGNFGEFVERCIWIPVFIFILSSFIKLRRMAISTPASSEADNTASVIPITPAATVTSSLQVTNSEPPEAVSQTPDADRSASTLPEKPDTQEKPKDNQL